jgi:hypothetical protein
MKSLRIAFMQIFYMQCIHEIRVYVLFYQVVYIFKRHSLHGKHVPKYVTSRSRLFLAPEIVNITKFVSDGQ